VPTYDGQCPSCKKKYEFFVQKWDGENPRCPDCQVQVERLITAARLSIFGAGETNFEPHYQYRRNDDGTSDKFLISSRAQQLEYIHHQHLNDPLDLPPDLKVDVNSKLKSESSSWI
jgi:putative FmdB family regulatory protein